MKKIIKTLMLLLLIVTMTGCVTPSVDAPETIELNQGDHIVLLDGTDYSRIPQTLKPSTLFTYRITIGVNEELIIETISTVDDSVFSTMHYNGTYFVYLETPEEVEE